MAHGGARTGSGRKPGVRSVPRFADLITDEDKQTFKAFMLESYMGDMRLTLWMADQIFGRAPQAIDMRGDLAISIIDDETREKAAAAIAAILPEGDPH